MKFFKGPQGAHAIRTRIACMTFFLSFFVLVFKVFCGHRPFRKNQKEETQLVVLVYVFREGSWQHFFTDLGSVLDSFREVFGLKHREKQVPERDEKTALKKV